MNIASIPSLAREVRAQLHVTASVVAHCDIETDRRGEDKRRRKSDESAFMCNGKHDHQNPHDHNDPKPRLRNKGGESSLDF